MKLCDIGKEVSIESAEWSVETLQQPQVDPKDLDKCGPPLHDVSQRNLYIRYKCGARLQGTLLDF